MSHGSLSLPHSGRLDCSLSLSLSLLHLPFHVRWLNPHLSRVEVSWGWAVVMLQTSPGTEGGSQSGRQRARSQRMVRCPTVDTAEVTEPDTNKKSHSSRNGSLRVGVGNVRKPIAGELLAGFLLCCSCRCRFDLFGPGPSWTPLPPREATRTLLALWRTAQMRHQIIGIVVILSIAGCVTILSWKEAEAVPWPSHESYETSAPKLSRKPVRSP